MLLEIRPKISYPFWPIFASGRLHRVLFTPSPFPPKEPGGTEYQGGKYQLATRIAADSPLELSSPHSSQIRISILALPHQTVKLSAAARQIKIPGRIPGVAA
jgi:hypothetical protein